MKTEYNVELPLKYPYKAKWWIILLNLVMFGPAAGLFFKNAMTNDRGLILNGVIEFDVLGASIFYWCLFFCALAFVAIALLLLYQRLTTNEVLEIGESSILIPRHMFKKGIDRVLIENIENVESTTAGGQHFITLHTPTKKYVIKAAMLPRSKDFDLILATILKLLELRSENQN